MSRYMIIETEWRDEDLLVRAIQDMEPGWVVERHETPVHLFGYHNDVRPEVAHVVVRRQNIGQMSNDIGFVRTANGTYQAIISDYDSHRYGRAWLGRLKQRYAYRFEVRVATKKGYKVVSETRRTDGSIELELEAPEVA